MNSAADNNAISAFWQWFESNQHKYLFLNELEPDAKEPLLDEFVEYLHAFCDSLYFEIGGHPDDEKVELIITAGGNTEFFPQVEALVSAAPNLKDWNIIAFKPPMGRGFKLNYEGKDFDASTILFIPLKNDNHPSLIGLQVCYPDYTEAEHDIYMNGTYLAIDTLIGEKSTALDIDYLDVAKTPEDISEYDMWHLEDIAEYIAARKNER